MATQKTQSLNNSFLNWMSAHQDLLKEITLQRRQSRVDISFIRFPTTLQGSLHHASNISVAAIRGNVCYDYVFDRDVSPVRTTAGWVCTQCREPQIFPSRAALFEDHLFRPFREWVMGPLRKMNSVEFISMGTGSTMVRLRPEMEVPLWIEQQHIRNAQGRDSLEKSGATREELHAFDRRVAGYVDAHWAEYHEVIDYDQLEGDALASLGPGGAEYLDGLTEDDYFEFDRPELGDGTKRQA